jgi:bacterioferritin (cytochrome b1)
MDIETFLRDPLSRRRFFRMSGVSVAGSSAVLLAACGSSDKGSGASGSGAAGGNQADVDLLNSALDLEFMAVAAYKAGATLLTGDVLTLGKVFLQQEQEHVDGLKSAIMSLGGKPNRAKTSYDFPTITTQDGALKFALTLENTAVAAYIDALPKLSTGKLRAMAASILTDEGEHIAVIRGGLGMDPVPDAFVTGRA